MLPLLPSGEKNLHTFAYMCTKCIFGKMSKKPLTYLALTKTAGTRNRGDFHSIPHQTFQILNQVNVVFIQT